MVHCFPWKAPRAALLPSALRVAWGMASLDRFSEDSRGETLGELKQNGWLYQQEEGFVGKSKKWDIMGYIYIYIMGYWLVVWSMNFIFPYIENFIIPTDFHIFQRGWNHQPGYVLIVVNDQDLYYLLVYGWSWDLFIKKTMGFMEVIWSNFSKMVF